MLTLAGTELFPMTFITGPQFDVGMTEANFIIPHSTDISTADIHLNANLSEAELSGVDLSAADPSGTGGQYEINDS